MSATTIVAFGEKASCESTPPSQYSALCRQHGPAVALCPVVSLSAVLSILSYILHLLIVSSIMVLQPGVARKMDL